MKAESWSTASSDVKQHIINRVDPSTARSLCQTNKNSRRVCQQRLSASKKYELCLKSAEDDSECDAIPMFSKAQFLSLIPKNIVIYAEDDIQLTHEFYSQNYKLPNEGFAVALRKAKIINTACAVFRPDFMLTSAARQLLLPSYVDASLVDATTKAYASINGVNNHFLTITLRLYNKQDDNAKAAEIVFFVIYDSDSDIEDLKLEMDDARIDLRYIIGSENQDFRTRVARDEFIAALNPPQVLDSKVHQSARQMHPLIMYHRDNQGYQSRDKPLNVFYLSRFLKIALDMGYYYGAKLEVEDNRELIINTGI
jgi:hypothetical protein